MNKDELIEMLVPFYEDDDVGIAVYAVLKGNDSSPKRLDIEAEALAGLKEMFLGSVRESILENADLSLLQLSDADERRNVVYEYDLEIPHELTSLQSVIESDNVELMSFAESALSSIKALIIEIGDNVSQLVIYKTIAPVNVFSRDSFFLRKSRTRLRRIDDEFLRINPGFQLFSLNGSLFVLDLKTLEKSFGFHDVVRREAQVGVDCIEQMGVIENFEVLREMIDDIKYARRLTKVARSSPVIRNGIQNESIIAFCQSFPNLSGRIRFNSEETKIVLDTKVSKDLFLKILMDDYLTSELTSLHYESLAKDGVESESEES